MNGYWIQRDNGKIIIKPEDTLPLTVRSPVTPEERDDSVQVREWEPVDNDDEVE